MLSDGIYVPMMQLYFWFIVLGFCFVIAYFLVQLILMAIVITGVCFMLKKLADITCYYIDNVRIWWNYRKLNNNNINFEVRDLMNKYRYEKY